MDDWLKALTERAEPRTVVVDVLPRIEQLTVLLDDVPWPDEQRKSKSQRPNKWPNRSRVIQ
jgi:hypothetical protein